MVKGVCGYVCRGWESKDFEDPSALRDLDLEQVTQTFLNFKLLICKVGMESPLLRVLVCLG